MSGTDLRPARSGTSLELLVRWLHRDDGAVADRVALATRTPDGWSELTYRELERRSAALAAALAASGVQPGDRVALLCEPGGDWTCAFFAVLRRGAIVVPLDTKLTREEVAALSERSRLAAAFVSSGQGGRRPAGVPVLDPRDQPSAEPVGADVDRPMTEPAVLVWTSGTTGRPKGVALSLANLAYAVEAAIAVQGTGPEARWLSVLPPNHLLELSCGLLPGLVVGSTAFVAGTVVPHDLAVLMAETQVNQMVVVPLVLKLMQRHIEGQARKRGASGLALRVGLRLAASLPSRRLRRTVLSPVHRRLGGQLRTFYCGGAPLDPEVVTFFGQLGMAVYQGYGLTEAGPTVAMNTPQSSRLGSVGRPLPGTEVRIGPDGEILVRSPGVMTGYWEDEATTGEVVDREGWLHTGDLGRVDDDGYLYVVGRLKTLIVLETGKKVQPEEVELALSRSPLFADICVVGWRRGGGGERVCAVVVPTPAFAASFPDRGSLEEAANEEVQRLAAGLSGYKRPTVVRVVDGELPKSAKRAHQRAEIVRLLEQEESGR